MANTDLNIRVTNNAQGSQTVMLYQQDAQLNVENYHVSAWAVTPLARGSQHDLVLPFSIQVQGRDNVDIGSRRTVIRRTDYNQTWNLQEDVIGAFDILHDASAPSPGADSISIVNKVMTEKKTAVALKDSIPLFASALPPGQRVNFQVMPKLYVALSSDYKEGKLYRAVTLSPTEVISFKGETAVQIEITENHDGLIKVGHKFVGRIPDFQPVVRENRLAA